MRIDVRGVPLSANAQATLRSLVRVVVPHLFEDSRDGCGLAERVEDRLLHASSQIAADLAQALDVFGSRISGLLVNGRPVPFARLSLAAQERAFAAWSRSPIPLARAIHQALRRLILTTWYATDEGRRELRLLPPLYTRSPALDWEGPLQGVRTLDSEPVARHPARQMPEDRATSRAIPAAVTTPESFSGDRTLTADVVVIGSGAGGAVAAARFAESGREVVILEDGDYLHTPDFSENEGELVPRLFAEQAMRATVDGSISVFQGGAVGGGTTVNWMMTLRPPDAVLDEWSRVAGISARDLAPHFDRVGEEIHARTPPDDAHSPSNRAILIGARKLAWHARAGMMNAKGCVQAGTCSMGCRYEAKQSGLVTYLPRAFAAGARLCSGARVDRIEVVERGGSAPRKRVHAVVRDPRSGEVRCRLTIESPVVVLAAGAVGTPLILQRSGLGGGGVGRYLRLHPTTAVLGLHEREPYPLAGIPQTALCDEFLTRDANGHGFWIESCPLQPALASAAIQGFGREHRRYMLQLKNVVPFIALVRDGSGTQASMGSVSLSRSGRVRITHKLTPLDRENLRRAIEAAARLQLAAGAREALSLHTPMIRATNEDGLRAMREAPIGPNRVALFSAHVNGTCRLGQNPATSGCSPTGERHGVGGLYVLDGSLLPTAPGVNPQWVIMALASLLAERAL